MDNLNNWPYTDIHELNLDWILEKVKALDTKLNDDIDTYVQEYIDEHFEDWTVNANYDPVTQTIVYTNGTGAQQILGDVIRFAIDNVFVDIKDATARTAAGSAQTTADGAVLDAAAAQSTADDAVLDAAAAQGTADANTARIITLEGYQAIEGYVDVTGSHTFADTGAAIIDVPISIPSGHSLLFAVQISNTQAAHVLTQFEGESASNLRIGLRNYYPGQITATIKYRVFYH